jgi:DNA-directed RNA polymerase specialized sigma subunit
MCIHYNYILDDKHRHYVYSPEYNNCVLCLVNAKGNMSQEEVGKYLGYSKMRILQIERLALKKLLKRVNFVT